jgi:hypothetical protein
MDRETNRNRLLLLASAAYAAACHFVTHIQKIPERTSALTGNAHALELQEGSTMRFKRAARMNVEVFEKLVDELKRRGLLHDTRKGVTVERYQFIFYNK